MSGNTAMEERIAHLDRMVDDLGAEVARLSALVARQDRQLQMLMAREAEREVEGGGTIPLADQRPPHW